MDAQTRRESGKRRRKGKINDEPEREEDIKREGDEEAEEKDLKFRPKERKKRRREGGRE